MTALLGWFLATRAGKAIVKHVWKITAGAFVVLAIAAGIFWFIEHERAVGIAEEKDRQHNADMAWLKEAQEIGRDAQAKAATVAAQLDQSEKSRAAQQNRIARLSAANDRRECIDGDGADRLLGLGAVEPGGHAIPRQRQSASPGRARR